MTKRSAEIVRNTAETRIRVRIDLDGNVVDECERPNPGLP